MRTLTFTCLLGLALAVSSCGNSPTETKTSDSTSTAMTTAPAANVMGTLTVKPQHHGMAKNLNNVMAYIKHDSKVVPANGMYDDSVKCSSTSGDCMCAFGNLKKGDYFVMVHGMDDSLKQMVKGGDGYSVSGDQSVMLPVNE
jgi:hypothetical protein